MENLNPTFNQIEQTEDVEKKHWSKCAWEGFKSKFKEYTDDESHFGKSVNWAKEKLEALNNSDRLKFLDGLSRAGYLVNGFKNNAMATASIGLANTFENKHLKKYFEISADLYQEKSGEAYEAAAKIKSGEGKDKSRLKGFGQGLAGNFLRYGRVINDFTRTNPLRNVTAGSMFVGSQSEIVKKMRLSSESAMTKTRVDNFDRAYEEARLLYEKAEAQSKDGVVKTEDLTKIYQDNLPKDVLERFGRNENYEGSNFLQKGMIWHMERSAKKIEAELNQIDKSDLGEPEKQARRAAIFKRNKKLLEDLDGMVSDQGTIDTFSYLARTSEKTGKTVATVMAAETAIESAPRLAKISAKLGKAFWDWTSVPSLSAEELAKGLEKGADKKETFHQIPKIPKAVEPAASKSQGNDWAGINEEVEVAQPTRIALEHESASQYKIAEREKTAEKYMNLDKMQRERPGIYQYEVRENSEKMDALMKERQANTPTGQEFELARVNKGEGVSHAIMRQLIGGNLDSKDFKPQAEHLQAMGYKGKVDDLKAIERWARNTAGKIVSDEGYYDKAGNKQTWVMKPGESAYVLSRGEDGKFSVSEWHDKDEDKQFELEEKEADNRVIRKPFEEEHAIRSSKPAAPRGVKPEDFTAEGHYRAGAMNTLEDGRMEMNLKEKVFDHWSDILPGSERDKAEVWEHMRHMSAQDILEGKFPEQVGNTADAAEEAYFENMQAQIADVQAQTGLEIGQGEKTEEFLERADAEIDRIQTSGIETVVTEPELTSNPEIKNLFEQDKLGFARAYHQMPEGIRGSKNESRILGYFEAFTGKSRPEIKAGLSKFLGMDESRIDFVKNDDGSLVIKNVEDGYDIVLKNNRIGVDGPGGNNWGDAAGVLASFEPGEELNDENIETAKKVIPKLKAGYDHSLDQAEKAVAGEQEENQIKAPTTPEPEIESQSESSGLNLENLTNEQKKAVLNIVKFNKQEASVMQAELERWGEKYGDRAQFGKFKNLVAEEIEKINAQNRHLASSIKQGNLGGVRFENQGIEPVDVARDKFNMIDQRLGLRNTAERSQDALAQLDKEPVANNSSLKERLMNNKIRTAGFEYKNGEVERVNFNNIDNHELNTAEYLKDKNFTLDAQAEFDLEEIAAADKTLQELEEKGYGGSSEYKMVQEALTGKVDKFNQVHPGVLDEGKVYQGKGRAPEEMRIKFTDQEEKLAKSK